MLNKLLLALNDFAWAYSLSAKKYVFISPNIEQIVGLTADEFAAGTDVLQQLIVAEDKERVKKITDELKLEDQVELHYRIKAGDTIKWILEKRSRFIDWESNAEMVLSVIKDVSDQNTVKYHLNNALADYSVLFDRNPSPMWIYEIPSLRIIKVNHAATEHYGYTAKEFLNMTIRDIRPKLDLAAFNDFIFRKGITKNKIRGYNNSGVWKHQNKNGEIIYAEVTGHEVKYSNTSCRIVVVNDVTERVLYQQEREQAERENQPG